MKAPRLPDESVGLGLTPTPSPAQTWLSGPLGDLSEALSQPL